MKNALIDMHCHAAGIGSGGSGCFISKAMARSWKTRFYFHAFGVNREELKTRGDGLIPERLSQLMHESTQVQAAVVLALDGAVDSRGELDRQRTEIYIPNDFLAKECCKYDNLLYGASVNPMRRDAIERLDAAVDAGAVLVKSLPSVQGFDPADRRLIPFYRKLADLRLPLLTHTGEEESFTRADNALADPARLQLALDNGVTVIAAHCASNGKNNGERNLSRLLPLFARYPNLYADISALTLANHIGHLQKVLRHTELHDRLLYGSDMPLMTTALTSPWLQLFSIGPQKAYNIAAIENPWDRDVALNLALGMPKQILTNAAKVIRLPENFSRSTP
ncbi:MAG: amidohydrolase family protein [Geobacteraceae bacterium]|nr:amidohydrolase family protein [Geobacteraceae bacterium]